MDDLERYYAKYNRLFYGDRLWDRMLESLSEQNRQSLTANTEKVGKYINEAGERIELKFQALGPELAQKADPVYRRWLADEFLRRILKQEMRQCPSGAPGVLRTLQSIIRQQNNNANRLVQTVHAMLRQCHSA